MRQLRDGRIALALQRPWADGTTHLVFTPAELLARLVPLVPRPRVILLLYHGVLAPNSPTLNGVVRAPGECEARVLQAGGVGLRVEDRGPWARVDTIRSRAGFRPRKAEDHERSG